MEWTSRKRINIKKRNEYQGIDWISSKGMFVTLNRIREQTLHYPQHLLTDNGSLPSLEPAPGSSPPAPLPAFDNRRIPRTAAAKDWFQGEISPGGPWFPCLATQGHRETFCASILLNIISEKRVYIKIFTEHTFLSIFYLHFSKSYRSARPHAKCSSFNFSVLHVPFSVILNIFQKSDR